MTEGIGRREFARLDGCSEGLVRRAIKQGRLRENPDGTIDSALAGTAWRQRSPEPPASDRKSKKHGAYTRPRTHPGVRTSAPPKADAEPEAGETYADALRRKEIALADLREQELAKKAGELVDRAAAAKLFFDTGREMRDAWIAWPPRVAVVMAEEIRVDPVTGKVDARSLSGILSAHVIQHLAEMGEPEASGLEARS